MVTSCSEDIELSTNSSNDEEFNPIVKGSDEIPADAQLEANMLNTSILDRICVQTRSLSDPTVVDRAILTSLVVHILLSMGHRTKRILRVGRKRHQSY